MVKATVGNLMRLSPGLISKNASGSNLNNTLLLLLLLLGPCGPC